ncbi:MAG TPA: hypothetical protein VGD58_24140 [Herpetosiphonaceae bacterium]
MTTTPMFRGGWLLLSMILILSIGLTVASLWYVRPALCFKLCPGEPCAPGTCQFGEQRAGFPFVVLRDSEIGSPTPGWGKLGAEDYPYANGAAFLVNIVFYASVLLGGLKIYRFIRTRYTRTRVLQQQR